MIQHQKYRIRTTIYGTTRTMARLQRLTGALSQNTEELTRRRICLTMTNATFAFAKAAHATLPKMECRARHVKTRRGGAYPKRRKQNDWCSLRTVTNEGRLGAPNRIPRVDSASRRIRHAFWLAQSVHLVRAARTIICDATGIWKGQRDQQLKK